ncbi:MAG: hypothetical protein HY270_18355 [Deltaproteobacteria bacterium]|nr:hypothetical protein [Deltaproteobacteria bacterium]
MTKVKATLAVSSLHACAFAVAAVVICNSTALADGTKSQGANTGDGSTPFTGLAVAPEANLFVGSGTTSIPIEVPPGHKMVTPKLALTYNSSGGPSPYGLGWDLPLGKIQRCGKHGVLSCDDMRYRDDFVLVLPGANIECRLDEPSGICSPDVEESFIRIEYAASTNSWNAWDKSGLHYVFGSQPNSPVPKGFNLFTPGANPSSCAYTFSWALDRIEDTNGNYLTIDYQQDSATYSQYPTDIRYGGNSDTLAGPLFDVHFDWEDRPSDDQPINGLGGFRAKLTKRLVRIQVIQLFAANGQPANSVIRSYEPIYQTNRLGRQSVVRSAFAWPKRYDQPSRRSAANTRRRKLRFATLHVQRSAPDESLKLSSAFWLRREAILDPTDPTIKQPGANRSPKSDSPSPNRNRRPDPTDATRPDRYGWRRNCGPC